MWQPMIVFRPFANSIHHRYTLPHDSDNPDGFQRCAPTDVNEKGTLHLDPRGLLMRLVAGEL